MYAVLAISATEEEIHQRTQTQDIFPTVYAQVSSSLKFDDVVRCFFLVLTWMSETEAP